MHQYYIVHASHFAAKNSMRKCLKGSCKRARFATCLEEIEVNRRIALSAVGFKQHFSMLVEYFNRHSMAFSEGLSRRISNNFRIEISFLKEIFPLLLVSFWLFRVILAFYGPFFTFSLEIKKIILVMRKISRDFLVNCHDFHSFVWLLMIFFEIFIHRDIQAWKDYF